MPKCDRCAWHEHLRDHCELDPGYPNGCNAFRPKPLTFWQGLLGMIVILGIYILLLWMEGASNADLRFALLAVPCALVAGLWLYRVREG